ncbi:hypothetical protein [Hymenobacter sp. BT491]|uniref:hypothetical protein n=1 Tax=Hymenobacter sp. BT491 TaxID=2766779 RepID=UPI0016534C62|nr:hypothetical protein [Hymenobacter sp. BT491]MBC6991805.1 hypothetical protein [Hymenobacter sp. BT491]
MDTKGSTTLDVADDIDLLLKLDSDGWSDCFIHVRNKCYKLVITHIFGDPYYDFMHSLMSLINGQQSTTFFWYNEPGGEKIEITKLKSDQNIVIVNIQSFREQFGREIKELEENICFNVKLNSLLIVSYMQLRKTFLLLKDRDFAQHRNNIFSFQKFIEFENAVKSFLKL